MEAAEIVFTFYTRPNVNIILTIKLIILLRLKKVKYSKYAELYCI